MLSIQMIQVGEQPASLKMLYKIADVLGMSGNHDSATDLHLEPVDPGDGLRLIHRVVDLLPIFEMNQLIR
jgi:hypothetical protein